MARPAAEIQIEGMKEVRKSLKEFSTDNGWRPVLRGSYGSVASMVEGEARTRAATPRPTLGGSMATMGGRAINSIKGKGSTTAATLNAFRGVAYGPGWNFGSKGRFRQFPRKAVPDYNLYAAIGDKRDQIVNEFGEKISSALDREF